MDIDDEVYSDLDFQQEDANENGSEERKQPGKTNQDEIDEDDYIEDEFEESVENLPAPKAPAMAQGFPEESKGGQRRATADLGNAAKVAKKEGVIEVVEADDGHEKALSSGSQFSEISVKDESEEENKNGGSTDAQILLDDQTEIRTDQQRNHVKGAVK